MTRAVIVDPGKFHGEFESCRPPREIKGTGGFVIIESTSAAALADYALDWNGLIKIEITPIMDDETISTVLPKHFS